ncbi:lipid A biosynthesis lauroyltransferase [Betaproteobacteria bacterium]|nr:lipid A biosynthesis lauroyltransferase [Betaproteobacteria bacterium]GHU03068.1 lipid A biosynthesis lauroyltransferase [Betaproteobacteria bacterium]GHU06142.1 lipid A biosynthesis lauroyltransferase [Betaproteobacteria bacterium]GHU22815.1 lipid A biosynthesis lauroyltransferase [Betaproteobacteria bacterium]GHU23890.1 lipid A biosynthesis lauroyltransferase [Betaproteobacteria bacterium]
MITRLLISLFWLLHVLPLPLLAFLGRSLGNVLYLLGRSRRRVVMTNLTLCFPELDLTARRRLARRHFQALGRSLLERGLLWWASQERLERIVRFEGAEHLSALQSAGTPVILLAPHFVGLDVGGARLAMQFDVVSIYARQKKNPVLDYWLHYGRSRFGDQLLLARQDGVRGAVKAMKAGRPFYYLPDMDYGRKDAIFVPFFGVNAATITGLSRLSRLARARVVPCVTRMLPGSSGYVLEIGEPWADFPTADVEADTRRMNAWLEGVVRTMPEQYYWVHRRFKTRPEGEQKIYPA